MSWSKSCSSVAFLSHRLSSAAFVSDAGGIERGFFLEFFDSALNGSATQSGGVVDGGDASSSEGKGFGGCPEAFLTRIKNLKRALDFPVRMAIL